MNLTNIYTALLVLSLLFLIAQLLVREKQIAHILFALFCGSIAIMATKKISGETLGAYQYLIGMGACATCNGYWLLSRSLFREKQAILLPHIMIALAIALLIMANQGYLFINGITAVSTTTTSIVPYVISEFTILLSSAVIMLSFWEGCRGFTSDTKKGKSQRLLFLTTFGLAVAISKLSQGMFAQSTELKELITVFIILFVLTNTQILLKWRFKRVETSEKVDDKSNDIADSNVKHNMSPENEICDTELALANKIEVLLIEQSLYLKANLKVADIARELEISEYKVSRVLKNNFNARNFNQYVNQLRVTHAKNLLSDPDKKKWPVLVVGLESGFASVGPFTRTFKLLTGYTPNQYRTSIGKTN